MKSLLPFVITAFILSISCEKGSNDVGPEVINFKGITNTDEEGIITSEDTSDWKLYENWKEKENSLFTTQMDHYCTIENLDHSIISYPNPSDGIFILDITKPDETLLAIRIVDKEFNVLFAKDSIYSTIAISLNEYHVQNDTVRIYYKFIGVNCELKGHGDIKIE